MWLSDYLQKRWGLFSLVGGITVVGLLLVGGGDSNHKRSKSRGSKAKASLKADPGAPKKLTVASVTRYCTQHGVAAASPARAQPQTVKHPGFPAARKGVPTLGKRARGLFPLRRKLAGMGARRLVHAPLLHRLAEGFTQRFHYFKHLAENRRAARRYYRLQAERRRKRGQPPVPGTVDPMGKAKVPPVSLIALRARGYRKNALSYYRELTTTRTLTGYAKRPGALLQYASLLMEPLPRLRARTRPQTKTKGAVNPAASRRDAGLRILHKLLEDHPSSAEAIEAMALLSHRTAARGGCPKIIFMLKKLSTGPLPPRTTGRRALLRGLAHYHAGRCLLKRGSHAAAAKRLARARADAQHAQKTGAKLAAPLAREASILWASAYAAAGDTSTAGAQLGKLGTKLAALATGVLVSQLLKEGQLRISMQLCSPRKPAPSGAK